MVKTKIIEQKNKDNQKEQKEQKLKMLTQKLNIRFLEENWFKSWRKT